MKALSKRYFRGWHAVLVCLLTLAGLTVPALRNHAQGPTSYTIIDLGTLGGAQSKAFGINNCGSVVGSAFTTSSPTPNPFFRSRDQATLTDIGNLGFDGTATAINASNFVVGNSGTSGGLRGFIWRDNNGNGVSDVGELVNLGTLPGDTDVAAWDINDAGRVVGGSEAALVPRAFVWQQGVMQEIAAVNGIDPSTANGINNAGQIVGVAFVTASSQRHAFFLDGSVIIDLKTLGGNSSIANEVNETGYVVGWSYVDPNPTSPIHAFIWRDADSNGLSDAGEMKDLGTLGVTHSEAIDINADGYVVGTSYETAGVSRVFVWHDDNSDGDADDPDDVGEMKDLNTLISDATWTNLSEARSINDGGQIVGFGTKSTGEVHAFLLTPTGFTPPSCPTPPPSPTPTPSPTVTVAVAPSSVSEDGVTNLAYTFTRTGSTASALTVNFSVSGGATSGTDYAISHSGSVTIPSGSLSADVTVNPTTDSSVEPNETVVLTVTAGSYIIGSSPNNSASGTITNDDTVVSVAVSPSSVTEDGATNLVYTFTRTGLTNAITVNFSFSGQATLNTDYTSSAAGSVSLASGVNTGTVTINPTVDTVDELDETVILTVTSGTGYTVGSPSFATGTITDDDGAPSISINNITQNEGNSGSSLFTFTVNLSNMSASQVTVNYATAAGTTNPATGGASCGSGTDFVNNSGQLTFTAGDTSEQVSISVCGDTTVEADETFFVNLSNNTNSTLAVGTKGTGTITNDDTNVSVTVAPASVFEDGGTNLVYTFTRTGVTSGALTVGFSVSETATLAVDYSQTGAATFTSTSGTVTFGAGNSTATITLNPATDTTVEADETVILTVTSGSGYTVGSPSAATGTITNDDTVVSVAVSPSSVSEDGVTNLAYTFTRTGSTASALTVNFSVAGGANPATFGTDYSQTGAATFTSTSGTVTFGAGNSTAPITLDPATDTTVEADETVILTVTSGSGYTVGSPSAATGTITNDDTDVTISVSPSTVTEDGGTNLIYTFTRTGVTSGALTVNFSVGGTATLGTDYSQSGAASFSSTIGTVTFDAGSPTASVTIDPNADATDEAIKTVIMTITPGTGYNVGSTPAATGSITVTAPTLVMEDGVNALAIDSVTFVRAPFRVIGDLNFSTDRRTRIMIFTSDLGLTQPDSQKLTVQAMGFDLPVEAVGPLNGAPGFSYIIVKLPENLITGNLPLTVTLYGVSSNSALLNIVP